MDTGTVATTVSVFPTVSFVRGYKCAVDHTTIDHGHSYDKQFLYATP